MYNYTYNIYKIYFDSAVEKHVYIKQFISCAETSTNNWILLFLHSIYT